MNDYDFSNANRGRGEENRTNRTPQGNTDITYSVMHGNNNIRDSDETEREANRHGRTRNNMIYEI